MNEPEPQPSEARTMSYGKEHVAVCRTYATPLEGIRTIPESTFDGRENTLFGLDVEVEVEGEAFLPSYSEGDNEMIVATDSMKNFVLHHAGEYDGATIEGFLEFVATQFLETYDHMSTVHMSATEFAFDDRLVPGDDGFEPSDRVFRLSDNEAAIGAVSLTRDADEFVIDDHAGGITGLELAKVGENSFTDFIDDEYTTLPERDDRTLFISLDISWAYSEPTDAFGPDRYVPAEQVRDIAHVVFDETDPNSIQDLIYQIGLRVLERFPQLESVSFEANNRTWIPVREDLDGESEVLREPPRPTGFQRFSMTHDDLESENDR